MLIAKDRIKELTSTTGAGTLTLTGAEAGFQAFSVLGNATRCYYTIVDVNSTDWEVGQGTYNSNTLTRDVVLESSNSGTAISLSATGSTVFVTYPSGKAAYSDVGVNRDYLADGNIDAGKPLILNTNNTVTQVAETSTTIPAGLGTLSSTTVTDAEDNTVAMGETNQFVNVYRIANASNIYLTPNTISSTDLKTITKGTTVSFDAEYERICAIIYEPNQGKYVAISMDSSNYVTGTAVTFNGTGSSATLTLGTRTVLDSSAYGGTVSNSQIAYDTTAQKIVLSYYAGNPFTLVVNLSGTTLTSGSRTAVPIVASYINSSSMKCAYSSTENRMIYLYATNDYGQPNDKKLYTTVGTVSGTSISFGSTAIVSNQPTPYTNNGKDAEVGVDNNGVVVLSYLSSGLVLQSQAGTLSNTTITWGSPSQVSNITCIETNYSLGESSIRPISNGKMIVTRATKSDSPSNASQGIYCIITVSGTTVTNGSVQTFSSSATRYPNASTNYPQTQAVINFGYGSYDNIIFQESAQTTTPVTNLSNDNYFGVASTNVVSGEQVGVNRSGSFNNNQSGMTAGVDQYVTDAGLIKERVTTTTTADTTYTNSSFDEQTSSYPQNGVSVTYDSVTDRYVRFYKDSTNSNYPVYQIGTYNNTTKNIDYATAATIASYNIWNNHISCASDGLGNIAYLYPLRSSPQAMTYANSTINVGSNTLNNTANSVALMTQSASERFYPQGVVYDVSASRFIALWTSDVSPAYATYGQILQVDSSSPNGVPIWSSSNQVTIQSDPANDIRNSNHSLIYDPDTERCVYFYSINAGAPSYTSYPRARVLSNSGTTITVGNAVTIGTGQYGSDTNVFTTCYDTVNDKIVFSYQGTTGTYPPMLYSIVTVTGGATNTVSFGTVATLTSFSSEYNNVQYDSTNNKIVYLARQSTPVQENFSLVFTSDGSTLTQVSSTSLTSAYVSSNYYTYGSVFVPNRGINYMFSTVSPSAILTFGASLGSTTSTVVNGSQFVGTARSGTDLELSEPPVELVGMANGSITKGKPVILRTDGDFQQAGLVSTDIPYSAGTETAISTEDNYFNGVSYDPDQNRYVAFYSESNNSYYGYAKSFIVTDKVISNIVSMGAFHASSTVVVDCCYIGNSKHIVFFTDFSYVSAIVVQVSADGTGTYGTEIAINSGSSENNGSCYYDSDKGVAVLTMGLNNNDGTSIAVSVSGLTITAGTQVTVPSGDYNVYYTSSSYNTEEKIGLVVWDSGSTSKLNSATISLSGTGNRTITFNSVLEVYNGSNEIKKGSLTYDPINKKHFLAYSDTSNMKGVVLTVSGTSVTKGTSATIYTGGETDIATQGTNQGSISIYHRDPSSPYYLKGVVATITGTDFTLSNEATLNATEIKNGRFGNAVYNPSDFTTTVIYVVTASLDLKATATIPNGSLLSTNLTTSNLLGFAQDTIADNEDVKVKIISQNDENQTGLTTASQYYVQTDGTLSTTAGTPSVLGGTALSSTKILIKS